MVPLIEKLMFYDPPPKIDFVTNRVNNINLPEMWNIKTEFNYLGDILRGRIWQPVEQSEGAPLNVATCRDQNWIF